MPVSEKGEKFQILADEVVLFEDRDDLNLAMKVSSDFLRADVTFVMVDLETNHHYMSQHIFEDAKKMILPELTPGFYRVIVFMQNVEATRNTIFQPVLYSFNFRLFSFIERDHTFLHEVKTDRNGDIDEIGE